MRDVDKHTEVLYDNKWVSLKKIVKPEDGIEGYVFSHEKRCNGKIVAILPFKDELLDPKDNTIDKGLALYFKFFKEVPYQRFFLIREEFTPCWGLGETFRSSITGGVENENVRDTAVEEIAQEAGYKVAKEDLIYLGTGFGSKSSDTVYFLFAVDLTGKEKTLKADGDGSLLEKKATMQWIPEEEIHTAQDPQVAAIYVRLNAGNSIGGVK
jgi:8-oxo-dGTP pyrophosphatase MutT (NUDIX family)